MPTTPHAKNSAGTEPAEPDVSTDYYLMMLEDFEFETPCDGRPGVTECDAAAKWWALLSCQCTRLLCEEHKDRMCLWAAKGDLMCLTCVMARGDYGQRKILYLDLLKSA